jgi:hypothetical protein
MHPVSLALLSLLENAKLTAAQALLCRALSRSTQFWSSFSGYIRETSESLLSFIRPEPSDQSLITHSSHSALVCLAFERSRSVGEIALERGPPSTRALTAHPLTDVAHDIYRNATFEKLALLRDLRAEVVRKEEWDERLRAVARQLRSELLVSLRLHDYATNLDWKFFFLPSCRTFQTWTLTWRLSFKPFAT